MDDDEATWKEWEITEVSKHNSPEDAWMVIHGKVYNVTPYLPYHPGGVSTLLKEAGGDGTQHGQDGQSDPQLGSCTSSGGA